MVSIITCTTDLSKAQLLYKNVAETVGTEFEFLPFDNSILNYGLCKVYNIQSKIAKGDVLCFVHDDVRFLTENWGIVIANIFKNNERIGLVGVAGSSYKTKTPSMWTTSPASSLSVNIVQHYKYKTKSPEHIYWKNTDGPVSKVVSIDGVLMIAKKEVLQSSSFDEKSLPGFHGYDMDFCFQVSQNHDIAVTYDVLIEHFSEGKANDEWFKAATVISKKWEKDLPRKISFIPLPQQMRLEYRAFFFSLKSLKGNNNLKGVLTLFLHYFRFSFVSVYFTKGKLDKL